MKKLFMSTACVLALNVGAANAQSMDYGAMQDLFGEPVTTSANGSPMRESDVPMNMTIISSEEIERFPAREIPDILRHYAGVSVRQNSATDYTVGIRGYNQPGAERLLVLVNGRQVYQDYFGLVNWSLIPVEMNEIRQIEVVRGPNTALFGFNAISGVVNIVTYNPLYDDIDTVEADAGLNSYARGSGIVTFQDGDKWGGRLSVGGMTIDEDEPNVASAEAGTMYSDARAGNVNTDVALKLDENTKMRFEASFSRTKENVLTAYYDGSPRDEEFHSIKANVTSDTDYGIIEASVYRNGVEADYFVPTSNNTTFSFDNAVTVVQLSDTFQIGTDHTFRVAGEYRNNQTGQILNGTRFGDTIFNIKSASGLWYWNINPDLALSVAGRYDHVQSDFDGTVLGSTPYSESEYNNVYDEFGYNLGLLYKVTDIDSLRFTAAKGVDLPSAFEVGLQAPAAVSTYGNPNLDVSDVHDFQIGYERSIAQLNGAFEANVFYQRINELQGFAALSPTVQVTSGLGDSEAYGFDLTLDGETDNQIRWGVNYSYTQIDDGEGNDTYEDLNSVHMVNANIGYSPNDKWDMDLYASYESEFDSERDVGNVLNATKEVDPDVILDARIAYKPMDKLTVSLNGQALFGENEQSAYGEDSDTQLFIRAKYDF